MTTPTVAATRATGNDRSKCWYEEVGGLPPVLPNTAVAMTQINHAPRPDTATSRMADHRRDSSAMMAMITMTPSEVIHQMVEISHRMPCGGELNEVATACSALELALVITQHTSSARTARPTRTPSEPRRRV